jgi:ribonuclease D
MPVELRVRPTKEQIAQLPPFVGLSLDRIHVVSTTSEFEAAHAAIRTERFIGFDTESKPTFTADAVRDGPHVIQFALRDRAFIVQLGAKPPVAFLRSILESEEIVKVGFGLKSDRGPLLRKLGIRLGASVELSQVLRRLRFKQALGVKAAVAVVLGQRLHKPKSVTTSNWAASRLSPRQLLYAANDAYAALTVFQAMGDQVWARG